MTCQVCVAACLWYSLAACVPGQEGGGMGLPGKGVAALFVSAAEPKTSHIYNTLPATLLDNYEGCRCTLPFF